MRLVKFMVNGECFKGRIDGDIVVTEGNKKYKLSEVKLLAPCQPSKVIAIGLNYADHAKELNLQLPKDPVIFMKPANCVIGPEEKIIYPAMSKQVDFEAELAIVIKKKTKNVSVEDAKDYILGYTCANDVTARDLQSKDGQWTRAKSFDTFCPIGPWIETELDTSDLKVELKLNGATKQSSSTKNLIFTPDKIVNFVSQIMTLEEEDIIITGTPSGIGPMQKGDKVEVCIEGIGVLTNYVE